MTETPQPPESQKPAAGYYPDSSGVQRYWDGNAWTDHTQGPGAPAAQFGAAGAGNKASRPWFKKKRFIIPLALVVLMSIGGIAGGGTEDTSDAAAVVATDEASADADVKAADDEKTEVPKAKAKPKPKAKPKTELVKVSSEQMLKDYEDNELAADKKYKGKRIQVTGTIEKIDSEMFTTDDEYVLRISNGDEYSFLTVNCNDMSKDELSTLTVGNQVTAVGMFDDGGDLGVELEKCKLA